MKSRELKIVIAAVNALHHLEQSLETLVKEIDDVSSNNKTSSDGVDLYELELSGSIDRLKEQCHSTRRIITRRLESFIDRMSVVSSIRIRPTDQEDI